MRVMAQMAMVMNLDKCIGCHTCSVTCKQAWTNRSGVEYVWFNNVETRPGQGYPRRYEDQERWRGGWELNRRGRLALKAGGRLRKLLTIFSNPMMPSIDDYYEPWTYDYDTLTNAPAQEHTPVARPKSLMSGQDMKISWSANWDDDLGGSPDHGDKDVLLKDIADKVKLEFEQTFMFYLPRICEHCLNPSCAASCPSGAIYKRVRGRHRPGRPGPLPRLADVRHRLPVQEDLLQPPHRQGGEVHVLLPAGRGRHPHRLLRDLRRPTALHRAGALRRRPRAGGRVHPGRPRPLRGAAEGLPRPARPGGGPGGRARRHPARLDSGRPALPDLRADQRVRGRAAAAPGVPHAADGLVHPAAVAGGRRRPRHRPRRRGPRQPLRRDRRASDPGRVPRPALHRRRRRAGRRRAAPAGRDAVVPARPQPRPRPGRVDPRHGRHDRRAALRHVPAAGHRQVRGAVRHPAGTRRAGAPARGAGHRVQPRLRRRAGDGRLGTVRRGLRRYYPDRGGELPHAQGPADRRFTDRARRPGPGQPAELGRQGRAQRALPAAPGDTGADGRPRPGRETEPKP